MTLSIGLIGAGANTRLKHIPGFQEIDGVEVVAVCNRSRESARKVADDFGIPDVVEDWKEVVHRDDVDAVCVGTWPYMHYEASQASDKVAMIVPGQMDPESEATTLDLIADGCFGDWLEIRVSSLAGGYDPKAPLHWRQRRDLSGNNIMAMGIYNENVHRYAGFEKSLVAHAASFTTERLNEETGQMQDADVPESVGIVAEMESGATAVYHLSNVARLGGSGADLELHGTKGAFKLEGGAAWVAGEGDSEFRRLELPPEKRGEWRVEREFVDAVREGAPVTHTNFADGVRYMEFTEAVHISLREGRRVEFPLPE